MTIQEQVISLFVERERQAKQPHNGIQVTIDGKNATPNIPLPAKWNSLLDERLDEGRLSIRHAKTPLFQPLTPVEISLTSKTGVTMTRSFLVSADESTETPAGSGYYNHELSLIEQTKELEGIIVDALTYTNDLGRNYSDGALPVAPNIIQDNEGDADQIRTPESYKNPLPTGNFTFQPFNVVCPLTWAPNVDNQSYYMQIFDNPNAEPIYYKEYKEVSIKDPQETVTLNLAALPTGYTVFYGLNTDKTYYDPNELGDKLIFSYSFMVAKNEAPLPKWNITSVINRLLDLAVPHLKSAAPKYKLNAAQAEEFSKIEAPEFAFSKMTLKEALDQIGGYIHGIPRLVGDTIYYDMLGGTKQATLSDPKYKYITQQLVQNVENYCTKLDSTVDNLVNVLDSDEGVITEPYINGYKTVRSEEAFARITDGNMIISTSLPIQSVQRLEVGPLPDGNAGGDITPYLFEAADYGRLSSFDGQYPTSKAYAIYYTQGQPNIQGLTFKTPSVIGGAGSQYAITNIIKAATGKNISASEWGTVYPKLAFRITYTPIFTSRVEQHKLYYPGLNPRTLAYNQSANLVETRYYGENLRGTVARMGNPEIIRTYRLNDASLIPDPGELWGEDYYVSSVAVAVYPEYVDCTVGLSQDFNRLSQYIGINSMHRMYEVSEKQAYNRDMVYADYCVIGDREEVNGQPLLDSYYEFVQTFFQQEDYKEVYTPLSAAWIRTLDEDMRRLHDVTLPVISTAMGNTLVFSAYMEDNFSAGKMSVESTNSDVSGYWQTNAPYCDYYGRVAYLELAMTRKGVRPGYDSPIGYELPNGDHTTGTTVVRTPSQDPLAVQKDNREILRLHYQIHCVSNRKEIITGPALTHNCPLVRGIRVGHSAALYVVPTRIGKFAPDIDTSKATMVHDYGDGSGISYETSPIVIFDAQTAPVSGAAWAIADKATGEILIAANTAVTAGEPIDLPTLTFKHTIY